jgi:hypothetical protein
MRNTLRNTVLLWLRPLCRNTAIQDYCGGKCESHNLLGLVFETHCVFSGPTKTEKQYNKLLNRLARKPHLTTEEQKTNQKLMNDVHQRRALLRLI